MTCPKCQHQTIKKFGTYGAQKIQRFRCKDCDATFTETQQKPLGNHTTTLDDAERVFALLTEGVSVRAIARWARRSESRPNAARKVDHLRP